MSRFFMLLALFVLFLGCKKTSKEEGEDKYKNQFLKLAEFDCDGITSDYYVTATIDNVKYCRSVNDTIQNVLRLFNNFTTSSPNSTDTISGSAYNTIWFGIFKDYGEEIRMKHLYFISPHYHQTASAYEIASDVFVEGRKWNIDGKNINGKSVECRFAFSDFRPGFNTAHFVSSKFGNQIEKYLSIDKVEIERFSGYVYYNVELSFEADLYMTEYITDHRNMWGELRNGKMKAKFKVPL